MMALPPHYMLYGYSPFQEEICKILDENGYSHISSLEENIGLQQSKMDSIFIITSCHKNAYRFPSYQPSGVYSIMDMPERHVKYSIKELQNLVNMLYGDVDTILLALNMFSKINMAYVNAYTSNIVDGFWGVSTSTHINNPYLVMLKNYSYINSNKILKREWAKNETIN